MLFTLLVASSSAGCLALVPMRETLELVRGAPHQQTTEITTNLNHTFTTDDPSATYFHEELSFEVSDDTVLMKMYFRATIPLDVLSNWSEQLGIDFIEYRYVEATLYDPDGEIHWHEMANTTYRPGQRTDRPPFKIGTWNLVVDSRGYGINQFGIDEHDEFTVSVTTVEPCIIYPDEAGCSIP